MTTAEQAGVSSDRSRDAVEIAGTDWPLYKLTALAAGLLVFALLLAVTQTLQVAVLGSAAVAALAWVASAARLPRSRS